MSTALDTTAAEVLAALRAMRRLADMWRLAPADRAQPMGSEDELELYENDPKRVPADVQRRWGRLLTIYRLRKTLLPAGDQATWVRSRDAGGELVIDMMLHDPRRLEAALEAQLAGCIAA